jgi:hypothetical protein
LVIIKENAMTTAEKVSKINECLLRSGAALKNGALAEIRDGKVFYSMLRQNATCVTKIKLTFKEIIWMVNTNDARELGIL